MTGKEVVKQLKKMGWVIDRVHGSHYVLKRDEKTVVVPVHGKKDLPIGLLNAIKKETGL